jgi:hypothetical protein
MMTSIENHVSYALGNANVKKWPFSHFYVENVFPQEFYDQILDTLREKSDFHGGTKYKGRTFADESIIPGTEFMLQGPFLRLILSLFPKEFAMRFPHGTFKPDVELRLIRDGKGYSIGPHTDAPWKVISLLFYLPADCSHAECGTSIYVPKDRDRTCAGGPHHKFDEFEQVVTAPYVPNACLGFWKSDNSWHGVEPVTADFDRDILLYNVYAKG